MADSGHKKSWSNKFRGDMKGCMTKKSIFDINFNNILGSSDESKELLEYICDFMHKKLEKNNDIRVLFNYNRSTLKGDYAGFDSKYIDVSNTIRVSKYVNVIEERINIEDAIKLSLSRVLFGVIDKFSKIEFEIGANLIKFIADKDDKVIEIDNSSFKDIQEAIIFGYEIMFNRFEGPKDPRKNSFAYDVIVPRIKNEKKDYLFCHSAVVEYIRNNDTDNCIFITKKLNEHNDAEVSSNYKNIRCTCEITDKEIIFRSYSSVFVKRNSWGIIKLGD